MSFSNRLRFHLFKFFKPVMVLVRNNNGQKLENTRVSNTTYVESFKNLELGNHVFIGHYNFIDSSNKIVIEEGCQITNYISILNHSSHIAIRLYGNQYSNTQNPKAYNKGEVKIGKYTFIGPHSVIMPDTSIGKGSIISSHSYVKGKFDDFSIIAGNPAKRIGDTRELDKTYLENHPELKEHYQKWAND